jgi:hypothetical protein
MLKQIPVPNRANAMVGPALPPYFYTIDRDRRARMADQAAIIGSPLQQRVSTGWLPLFSMPPPPSFIPVAKFQEMMGQAVENRFRETVRHIARIRARGGRVVFVRLPVSGPLIAREEQLIPLAAGWGRLVKENGIPAINFAEHADLNTFECPEWSHLSAGDSVEFTRRLVPHLQSALRNPAPILAAAGSTATAKTAAAPF